MPAFPEYIVGKYISIMDKPMSQVFDPGDEPFDESDEFDYDNPPAEGEVIVITMEDREFILQLSKYHGKAHIYGALDSEDNCVYVALDEHGMSHELVNNNPVLQFVADPLASRIIHVRPETHVRFYDKVVCLFLGIKIIRDLCPHLFSMDTCPDCRH